MAEKVAFIINPASGRNSKKNIPDLIRKHMDASRFSPELYYTERRDHATVLASRLLQEGTSLIVAVGGDGTVNEVAKALMHTEGVLGIIPAGSGNGLARHLNIPLDPVNAIEVLNKRYSIKMDVGTMNNCPFFCTSGVGFDAWVGKLFAQKTKRGFQTYVQTTMMEFFHYKAHHYKISYSNEMLDTKAFLITVGNTSQYGNNAFICPYADVQDGLFDVSIITPFPKIFAFDLGRRLFNGTIDRSRYTRLFTASELKIRRTSAGPVHIDGEPHEMGEELVFKMMPASLNVMVNPK